VWPENTEKSATVTVRTGRVWKLRLERCGRPYKDSPLRQASPSSFSPPPCRRCRGARTPPDLARPPCCTHTSPLQRPANSPPAPWPRRTPRCCCPAPPYRLPYSPYKFQTTAHFVDAHSPLPTCRDKGNPLLFWSPIPAVGVPLLQPAPLRCKAFSLLSSSPPRHHPLSSGISSISGVGSRFGVIGIYHGCCVDILNFISIFLFSLLRLDLLDSAVLVAANNPKPYILKVLYFLWSSVSAVYGRPAPRHLFSILTNITL